MTRSRHSFALWSAAAGLLLGVWMSAIGLAAEDRRGPNYALGETAAQTQPIRAISRAVPEDWPVWPSHDGAFPLPSVPALSLGLDGRSAFARLDGTPSHASAVWFYARAPPSGYDV